MKLLTFIKFNFVLLFFQTTWWGQNAQCSEVPGKNLGTPHFWPSAEFQTGTSKLRFILDTTAPQSSIASKHRHLLVQDAIFAEVRSASSTDAQDPDGGSDFRGATLLGSELDIFDSSDFEEETGFKIDGRLGIDFLRRYCVHIDFMKNRLEILNGRTRDNVVLGDQLRCELGANQLPEITLSFPDGSRSCFSIDTTGQFHLGVDNLTATLLEVEGFFKNSEQVVTWADRRDPFRGRGTINQVQIGNFQINEVPAAISGGNSIGLGILCGFDLTFDLRNNQVFFKRNRDSPVFSPFDRLGFAFRRRQDGSTDIFVNPNWYPYGSRIKSFDKLLKINGAAIEGKDFPEIHRMFNDSGDSAILTVNRGGAVISQDVALKRMGLENRPPIPLTPPQILAECKFNPRHGKIVVPVKIEGIKRPLNMYIDTGSSVTILDAQYRRFIGSTLGATELASSMVSDGDWIRFPSMSIGSLQLQPQFIGVIADLTKVRDSSGINVDGILGFDALANHVVQLDFDAGVLRILSSSHRSLGTPIPFEFGRQGRPFVKARLGSNRKEWLLVDTGATFPALGLPRSVVRSLESTGELTRSIDSTYLKESCRLNYLRLGDFVTSKVSFCIDDLGRSYVGTTYLSRFSVTFDGPNRLLFLNPGDKYQMSDPENRLGLLVEYRKNVPVVIRLPHLENGVERELRIGDELCELNGVDVSQLSVNEIHEIICNAAGNAEIKVRRGKLVINFRVRAD